MLKNLQKSRFLKPYYVLNTIIILSYLIVRKIFVCDELEKNRSIEKHILFSFLIFLFAKYLNAANMDSFLSTSFLAGKIIVLILTFICGYFLTVFYLLIFLLFAAFLHQPEYEGKQRIQHLTKSTFDSLLSSSEKPLLVEFYATWASRCKALSSIFAQLSLQFPGINFAKIDVSFNKVLTRQFDISDSSLADKLPTFILFVDKKEVKRIPNFNQKAKDCNFKPKFLIKFFDLDNLSRKFNVEEDIKIKEQNKKED
ncbi:hypothetical protein M0811_05384 [Anaeramoeba ignava]|uniref:Thioredoxin domain-containing protein n=1 Tax=Anaeramoeba ignava TaxID=1746090 RepID=A0A9Q0LQU8_ANAIG|nr:hypothetical protein M0811_05384 [Anaeramoeba ignava]